MKYQQVNAVHIFFVFFSITAETQRFSRRKSVIDFSGFFYSIWFDFFFSSCCSLDFVQLSCIFFLKSFIWFGGLISTCPLSTQSEKKSDGGITQQTPHIKLTLKKHASVCQCISVCQCVISPSKALTKKYSLKKNWKERHATLQHTTATC